MPERVFILELPGEKTLVQIQRPYMGPNKENNIKQSLQGTKINYRSRENKSTLGK